MGRGGGGTYLGDVAYSKFRCHGYLSAVLLLEIHHSNQRNLMIVLAILFPPLYFLVRKRWGMFILTGAMFFIGCCLALTIALLPVSIILWIIAMIPAALDNRRTEIDRRMVKHADLVASKMAEKFPQSKTPPPLPIQTLK